MTVAVAVQPVVHWFVLLLGRSLPSFSGENDHLDERDVVLLLNVTVTADWRWACPCAR